jgi:hypothetical protein
MHLANSTSEYDLSLLGMMLVFFRIYLHLHYSFHCDIDSTAPIGEYFSSMKATSPVLMEPHGISELKLTGHWGGG